MRQLAQALAMPPLLMVVGEIKRNTDTEEGHWFSVPRGDDYDVGDDDGNDDLTIFAHSLKY